MKTNRKNSKNSKFRNVALFAIAISALTLTGSCRKDDDEPNGPKISPVVENTNATVMTITDANASGPQTTESAINIYASGTIKDISKMVVELNVDCSYGRDLSFALQSPDGTKRDFIYRAGDNGNYVSINLYRFNSTFTTTIPQGSAFDFPAGNYKESKGDYPAVILEPIFSSFNGKQVNGVWKLLITDHEALIAGTLKSWKLHFGEGALNQ